MTKFVEKKIKNLKISEWKIKKYENSKDQKNSEFENAKISKIRKCENFKDSKIRKFQRFEKLFEDPIVEILNVCVGQKFRVVSFWG